MKAVILQPGPLTTALAVDVGVKNFFPAMESATYVIHVRQEDGLDWRHPLVVIVPAGSCAVQ